MLGWSTATQDSSDMCIHMCVHECVFVMLRYVPVNLVNQWVLLFGDVTAVGMSDDPPPYRLHTAHLGDQCRALHDCEHSVGARSSR